MRRLLTALLFSLLAGGCATRSSRQPPSYVPADYAGRPFADSKYHDGPQRIPGTVMCAYYDQGGEGVAYHYTHQKNPGSGGLNPLNGDYFNEFRHDEPVGISYTKYGIKADNSPYNKVTPPDKLFYVGWTEAGEWFNLTVEVAQAGTYKVDLLYTSNRGGVIAFDLNGRPAGEPVQIESTADPADPVAWRQWHHWNVASDIVEVQLPQGKNLLTVHIVEKGNMNLATLTFTKK
jgi:hypothetical protein